MSRWMILILLSLAVPALADKPRGGPTSRPHRGDSDSGFSPEDEKAVHDYKLTKDKLAKLADAGKRMEELAKKDPSVKKAEKESHNQTLDETVKTWERYPQAIAVVKSAGLSPKEYLVGMSALVTSAMFAGMKRSNPEVQAPSYVNPDNVKFLADHPDAMEQFQGMFDRR